MKNLNPQSTFTFDVGARAAANFELPPGRKCVWNVGEAGKDAASCDEPATERVRIRIKQADVLAPLCLKHGQQHRHQAMKTRKDIP